MYEKYIEKFFATENITEKETFDNLFNKLEKYDTHLIEWDNQNLEEFIKNLSSVSVNSINKYLNFIRDFYKFVCKQENIQPKELKLEKDLKYYIDFEELMRRTINQNHYKMILNLLTVDSDGYCYNYRDACILVLAWSAHCTNTEIKNLMKSDIKFYTLREREVCRINLKNRFEIIEDVDEIEIIKKTITQDRYFVAGSDKKKDHFLDLKSTPALIRPVATRQSDKKTVANPSEILRKSMAKVGQLPGTNILPEELSLEDIVRSKKIMLLRRENIDTNDIKNIFGKTSECDIYWLSSIACVIQRFENQQKQKI